jgi:hypothetical protein
MPFAQGARTRLSYIAEVTYGTTPSSSPTYIQIPFNTHSLDLQKTRVQSNMITSDRMPSIDRHGQRSVAGDIVVEMRPSDYDWLLEGALFGAFSSNILNTGTTVKSFSIEDAALDISQFRTFEGVMVNTMQMSLAPNAMTMATFGLMGQDMAQAATAPTGSSYTAYSTNEPFDSFSGSITEGGSTIALLNSLDFTLNNNLNPTYVLGSALTPQMEFGMSTLEGSMTLYYQDAVLIAKFLAETESSLSIVLDDRVAGKTYTLLMPRIKINGAAVPVGNPQSRLITVPFVALKDSTTGTQLRITRTTT